MRDKPFGHMQPGMDELRRRVDAAIDEDQRAPGGACLVSVHVASLDWLLYRAEQLERENQRWKLRVERGEN